MSLFNVNPISHNRGADATTLGEDLIRDAKRSLKTKEVVHEANCAALRAAKKLPTVPSGDEVIAVLKKGAPQGHGVQAPHFAAEVKEIQAFIATLEEGKKAQVVDFYKKITAEATQKPAGTEPGVTLIPQAILTAKELLGQVIFLLDKDVEKLVGILSGIQSDEKIVENDKFAAMKAKVAEQFGIAILAKQETIKQATTEEKKRQIIGEDAFLAAELAKEVATLLITSKGFFNLAISDAATKKLLPETAKQKPFEKEIERVLDLFKNDLSLQKAIKATSKPTSEAVAFIIKATLGLASTADVTDVDAKRAHLAAHLAKISHQKDFQDEFASKLADQIKTIRPDRFAQDLTRLFAEGSLVSTIQGEQVEFEINLEDICDDLNAQIDTNPAGELMKLYSRFSRVKTPLLWDSISIKAACLAMGIPEENHAKAVKDALGRISETKGKQFTITPDELINELSSAFEKDQEGAYTLGCLGFSSKSTNLLLRAWQVCIQDLALQSAETAMKGRVLRAVESTLFNKFTGGINQNAAVKQARERFLGTLQKDLVFEVADNLHKLEGITTPEQFSTLVKKHVASSLDEAKLRLTAADAPAIDAVKEKLTTFVDSKAFLKRMLQRFDAANAKVDAPATGSKSLPTNLPWSAPLPNNPFTLLRSYFGEAVEEVKSITAKSASALQNALYRFVVDNPSEGTRYGLVSGEHTFALSVDTAKFTAALSPDATVPKFDAPLGRASREQIATWVKEQFIAPDLVSTFDDNVSDLINDEAMSLKQFRDRTLWLTKYFSGVFVEKGKGYADSTDPELVQKGKNIERMLDSFIMRKALPEELKKELAPHILPFAQSTWSENKALCFYPDPLGQGLRLGVLSKGASIRPLNQDEWLKDSTWRLFATKIEAPVAVT